MSGKLTYADGSPVSRYQVYIFPAEPSPCATIANGGINQVSVTSFLTSGDGLYRFRGLKAGSYLLLAKSPSDGRNLYWWQDQRSCERATVVKVAADVTINLTVP